MQATKTIIEFPLIDLEEYLQIENEVLVRKFMQQYKIKYEDALQIHEDLLRWLWLCGVKLQEKSMNGSVDFLPFIDTPIHIIDKMWHTFILFTQEYKNFCMKHFGLFIHHVPTTYIQKENIAKAAKTNPQKFEEELLIKKRLQYSYIYEMFGRETLDRWYKIYPKKYTRRKVHKLKIY